MKTLAYILIIVLFSLNLPALAGNDQKIITLGAKEKGITKALLEQSAVIIQQRLHTYGIEARVKAAGTGDQVIAELDGNTDISGLEGLFTAKGDISFTGGLTKADIEPVGYTVDSSTGSVVIDIRFKPDKVKAWAEITRANLGKPLSIMVDGAPLYSPVIKTPIEDGKCNITGNFTERDARYLRALINNNSLPVSLVIRQK